MPRLFSHVIVEGTNKTFIQLPNYYDDGAISTIGSVLGIRRATADEVAGLNDDSVSVSEGLRSGKLIRLRISHRPANSTRRLKSSRIICPISYAKVAVAAILAKVYRGEDVVTAGVPRRRRLG